MLRSTDRRTQKAVSLVAPHLTYPQRAAARGAHKGPPGASHARGAGHRQEERKHGRRAVLVASSSTSLAYAMRVLSSKQRLVSAGPVEGLCACVAGDGQADKAPLARDLLARTPRLPWHAMRSAVAGRWVGASGDRRPHARCSSAGRTGCEDARTRHHVRGSGRAADASRLCLTLQDAQRRPRGGDLLRGLAVASCPSRVRRAKCGSPRSLGLLYSRQPDVLCMDPKRKRRRQCEQANRRLDGWPLRCCPGRRAAGGC